MSVLVEQAIARGEPDDRIAAEIGCSLSFVRAVRVRMDAINCEADHEGSDRSWLVANGHGTHAGYNRHKAHGQQPCRDCSLGEKAYQRARHARRKQSAA